MFGSGLLKGLGITLQHMVESFTDDRKKTPSRYENSTELGGDRRIMRQPVTQEGLLTLQYPEEKRLLPERFRYIPMLLFDTETGEDRCTACGICAKVCPPQCIWIVRDTDENGKPVTRPAEFYIDATICMSCSFCAEFCPFDAIKMNHDHELAVYDRYPQLVYDKAELTVPLEYYAALWPTQFAEEQARIKAEREAERAKAEAKAKADAEKKAAAAAKAAAPAGDGEGAAKPQRSAADVEAMKRQAQERAAAAKARAAGKAAPMASQGATSGGAEAPAQPAASEAGLTAPAAAAADALSETGDVAADAPAAAAIADEAPLDAEAAKKARMEELKRKAQEAAAKRKQGG
jgi:NADH-quinone oxidoreductase subunit I